MKNNTYLETIIRGSEYGLPVIKIEMADASFEQTIVAECQKHLPYRLCEFTVNFTTEAIMRLLLEGFEIIVNLDNGDDIRKIPRAAKIKLTISITSDTVNSIALLSPNDDVIFTNVQTDEDVETLKGILIKTMTRARVYLKQPDDVPFNKYKEFIVNHKLPTSLVEM